jgi:carboxymethylenebutenolidase
VPDHDERTGSRIAVSVLKGEGKVPILFGSTSIVGGTRTLGGYLARPDLTGEWPTIVVAASEWGVTSSVKDLCRRLARHGFAVVAPDLYRGAPPRRGASQEDAVEAAQEIPAPRADGDLDAIAEYIANPAGFWSNAEQGFGTLGVGEGARFAVPFAARRPGTAIALLAPRLSAPPVDADAYGDVPAPLRYPNDAIGRVVGPIFGASGRDDPTVPVDDVMELRRLAPHAEWVLYDGVGSHFTDDSLDGYDPDAHRDALERVVGFFEKHLP